ncbi:hypothetical protein ABE042_12165 [Viridibacillus arvi]|uniref:hypothetical protein n=1 Tax=Viridibacillus arvi TaxID=263475 RepID=UPI003D278ADA
MTQEKGKNGQQKNEDRNSKNGYGFRINGEEIEIVKNIESMTGMSFGEFCRLQGLINSQFLNDKQLQEILSVFKYSDVDLTKGIRKGFSKKILKAMADTIRKSIMSEGMALSKMLAATKKDTLSYVDSVVKESEDTISRLQKELSVLRLDMANTNSNDVYKINKLVSEIKEQEEKVKESEEKLKEVEEERELISLLLKSRNLEVAETSLKLKEALALIEQLQATNENLKLQVATSQDAMATGLLSDMSDSRLTKKEKEKIKSTKTELGSVFSQNEIDRVVNLLIATDVNVSHGTCNLYYRRLTDDREVQILPVVGVQLTKIANNNKITVNNFYLEDVELFLYEGKNKDGSSKIRKFKTSFKTTLQNVVDIYGIPHTKSGMENLYKTYADKEYSGVGNHLALSYCSDKDYMVDTLSEYNPFVDASIEVPQGTKANSFCKEYLSKKIGIKSSERVSMKESQKAYYKYMTYIRAVAENYKANPRIYKTVMPRIHINQDLIQVFQ